MMILQDGELQDFLQNPPQATDLQWVGTPSQHQINGVIIPIGYTPEQIKSKGFQQCYQDIAKRFNSDFSPEFFNLCLFTGKEPDLCVYENKIDLDFNDMQMRTLQKKMSHAASIPIEQVHFLVNPDAFDAFHKKGRDELNENDFGYAPNTCTVNSGPYLTKKGAWELSNPSTLSHEASHALTMQLLSPYEPIFANDYYTRPQLIVENASLGRTEAHLLKVGCLSEYRLEDMHNRGFPLPSHSFCINKAEELCNTEGNPVQWHDTGLKFQDDKTGKIHRIFSPHNGKSLMGDRILENNRWVLPAASAFHKNLCNVGAKLHLAFSNRREEPQLLHEYEISEENRHSFLLERMKKSETIAKSTKMELMLARAVNVVKASFPPSVPEVSDYGKNLFQKPYRG
jgi:hypothetical protein